ncbi:hypothetical protein KFK09_004743 [Dendrobium nobile]|uniref:Uncharacterized protein n=1 Tax=Dendrobium nobile TaxID=94219 RepID=A0A8T3BTT6_DENNO|nr:hypothetical protein KFK09_004743 [Dendrobium nobile]
MILIFLFARGMLGRIRLLSFLLLLLIRLLLFYRLCVRIFLWLCLVVLLIIGDVGVELIPSYKFQSPVVLVSITAICSGDSPVVLANSPIHASNDCVVGVPSVGQVSCPALSPAAPTPADVVSPNVAPTHVAVSNNNCCINFSDSLIIGDDAELSVDNYVSFVDSGEETLAVVGEKGIVMPLVDVPISILSNAKMLTHIVRDVR